MDPTITTVIVGFMVRLLKCSKISLTFCYFLIYFSIFANETHSTTKINKKYWIIEN